MWAELQESESFLSQLSGYWVVSGVIQLICDSISSCCVLDKGLALFAATREAEQVCLLVERLLTQLERLQPQRFSEVLEHVTKSTPAAISVCYVRAPQDSEAHYAATIALAERILVVMEKH